MEHAIKSRFSPDSARQLGQGVVGAALSALEHLGLHWDPERVADWVDQVSSRKSRVVLSGMGKSGLVAQKIAATMASTGTPSFFLHPGEALHGDLGMIAAGDMVLMLSNSGESEEILRLLPSFSRLGISIAAITSNIKSTLATEARWCFSYQMPEGEGCPIDLAPMASTTLQLVWGDILSACLMGQKGFTPERFAELHPGGSLGAKLLKIEDLMHVDFAQVQVGASFIDTLHAISNGKLGMTTVFDGPELVGVISDGDIRRALERSQSESKNPLNLLARDLITGRIPQSLARQKLAIEAASLMDDKKITFLLVTSDSKPCGIIHIHDLLSAKVI